MITTAEMGIYRKSANQRAAKLQAAVEAVYCVPGIQPEKLPNCFDSAREDLLRFSTFLENLEGK